MGECKRYSKRVLGELDRYAKRVWGKRDCFSNSECLPSERLCDGLAFGVRKCDKRLTLGVPECQPDSQLRECFSNAVDVLVALLDALDKRECNGERVHDSFKLLVSFDHGLTDCKCLDQPNG